MFKIKGAMSKVALATAIAKILLTTIFPLAFVGMLGSAVIDWLTPKNNAEDIYNTFEVESLDELVVIKKSEDNSGYYLDFVDDFQEKVEKIVEKANYESGKFNLPKDAEFLKKLIKAEIITKFPNLEGNIPEGSSGFQGAINIRRVTPNKEIGSVDNNPGRGETTTIEKPEVDYDDTEMSADENMVKEWSAGQKMKTIKKSNIYEQGENTEDWYEKKKENSPNENDTIPKGTEVTYTGTYKKYVSKLSKEIYIYVEVETEQKEKIYLRSTNLIVKEEETEVGKIQNKTVTSRAKEEKQEEETKLAGKEGENYTIAIAAGHNNKDDTGIRKGSLIEEQLTIKTAEKVEELLKPYTNIKVVQTGSTSENKGGISAEDRVKLARQANPDLCIQIHFDGGGKSGVQAIYKDGDDVSRELGIFVSESMANAMNLPNLAVRADSEGTEAKNLGIIENSVHSGFPSIITKGGFIDGEPDATILKNNGTDLYAQGIVEGILKYLEADHSGLIAIDKNVEKAQESVESRVYNLKYVEPQILEEYINNGNLEALKVFTLDEESKLVTATWNQDENGKTLKKNASIDFRTILQYYHMPIEYLLTFYIQSKETNFTEQLADEIIDNTEIIIAVQDNIMTNRAIEITKEKLTSSSMPQYNYNDKEIDKNTKITENCTPKIEITYADAWCTKFSKKNSYSSKALDWKEGETEKIINIQGKVTVTESETATNYEQYDTGEATSMELNLNNEYITYDYTKYRKTDTSTKSMNITYETGKGEVEKEKESKFVKLYEKNNMSKKINKDRLLQTLGKMDKTANLVDLTEYLIYQATSISNKNTKKYEFNEFNIDGFSGSDGIYGSTVQEKIWWALLGAGCSKEQAAGVLGNIEYESGFEPNKIEGGFTDFNGGIGICQWTNDPRGGGSGRNSQLKAYAESKGKEWTDVDTQIEFLLGELRIGGGTAVDFSDAQLLTNSVKHYKPTDWVNATTPEEAAVAFMWTFERPDYSISPAPRQQSAKRWYEEFKDKEKPAGSTSILAACEEVTQGMIGRQVHYSLSTSELIFSNIESASNSSYACCATYVSVVLLKSGALTPEQINAYNYNYTGSGGVPDMLAAAGWRMVSHDEIQPGDVINDYGIHVMIYAGGDMVYDNNTCVIKRSGEKPYGYGGGPIKGSWSRRIGNPNVQVWRAP